MTTYNHTTEYGVKITVHPANTRVTVRIQDSTANPSKSASVWMTKTEALRTAQALIEACLDA